MPHDLARPILTLQIRGEHDVVAARQRTRQVAELLGLGGLDQTRVATAVSEIARNALRYAGGGDVSFLVEEGDDGARLAVEVVDQGGGIDDLPAVLEGRYTSSTGMGLGIVGARRVMDRFEIRSEPGAGTRIRMTKALPAGRPATTETARVAEELARRRPETVFEELQRQNRELLDALDQLRERQQQLLGLNRELEDTNRGVVALYAELDERVEQLRRSDALRRQFTSYLSHEFRTPLDSILALSGLLLDRVDGALLPEQERQVEYIRRSARDLLAMVDDLLDTARVDAGQVAVRPETFSVTDLFNALRATLRPLATSDAVALVFEDPPGTEPLYTDPAKVSQILRNLVSNALKFTSSGTVRVSARPLEEGNRIRFTVDDTGIGIPPEMQQWIFEDFAQVEGAVQGRVRGTGLGLPLSRKLARLLGGEVTLQSVPGTGSTFVVDLPRVYRADDSEEGEEETS